MIDHDSEDRFELPLHSRRISINFLINYCTFFLKLLKKQFSLCFLSDAWMLTLFFDLFSRVVLILDVLISL